VVSSLPRRRCQTPAAAAVFYALLLLSTLAAVQDEVATRLLDRLEDCRRSFETAIVLGGAGAKVAERLAGGRSGIQQVIHVDTSMAMLERARSHAEASSSGRQQPHTRYVHWQADLEILPLEPGCADREWGSCCRPCCKLMPRHPASLVRTVCPSPAHPLPCRCLQWS
jgi:hypothetical protein